MMGYNGVKFDDTGQNTSPPPLIQLKGKQYSLVWPEKAAAAKLRTGRLRLGPHERQ